MIRIIATDILTMGLRDAGGRDSVSPSMIRGEIMPVIGLRFGVSATGRARSEKPVVKQTMIAHSINENELDALSSSNSKLRKCVLKIHYESSSSLRVPWSARGRDTRQSRLNNVNMFYSIC